jgi:hypothetical protein
VLWSFTVDDYMVLKPQPPQFQLKASTEFQAATANWNKQAAGSKGAQERLPRAK